MSRIGEKSRKSLNPDNPDSDKGTATDPREESGESRLKASMLINPSFPRKRESRASTLPGVIAWQARSGFGQHNQPKFQPAGFPLSRE